MDNATQYKYTVYPGDRYDTYYFDSPMSEEDQDKFNEQHTLTKLD